MNPTKTIFMKKVNSIIGLLLMPMFMQQLHAQANTQLSNLTSPTKVNLNLLPSQDNLKDLGSTTKSWKDVYMDGVLWRGGYPWLGGGIYYGNTFLGQQAGNYLVTNGDDIATSNTFLGNSTGLINTTGSANTFVGDAAGYYNTTGSQNTFLGWKAGEENTTGGNNIYVGNLAGDRNTTGSFNVMIGQVAGAFNKTGHSNVFLGNVSGYLNSVGSYNTFVGDSSGLSNTDSYNTMVGSRSGMDNSSGFGNSFLGTFSGMHNTTGNYVTAVGYYAIWQNGAATGNTALGYSTGTLYTNGSNNTFIGFDADASGANFSNSMALGNGSRISASNQVRIGSNTVTSIGGFTNWTNISDGRFKKNIKADVPGLSFITKLKPVTYNLDITSIESRLSPKKEIEDKDENTLKQDEIFAKEKIVYTGFVAQDVEKAAKDLHFDFSGVGAPKNSTDVYGLRYAEFVVPLVKAVQELSAMNDAKDAVILQQQKQIEAILQRLEVVEKKNGISNTFNSGEEGLAFLAQNVPNPFNSTTVINYSVPKMIHSATMNIINTDGKILKSISLNNKSGNVTLSSNDLASGNYFYELIVDGKKSGSRQMTVIK